MDKRLRVLVGILGAKYKQCRRETGRVRACDSANEGARDIDRGGATESMPVRGDATECVGVGDMEQAKERERDRSK